METNYRGQGSPHPLCSFVKVPDLGAEGREWAAKRVFLFQTRAFRLSESLIQREKGRKDEGGKNEGEGKEMEPGLVRIGAQQWGHGRTALGSLSRELLSASVLALPIVPAATLQHFHVLSLFN